MRYFQSFDRGCLWSETESPCVQGVATFGRYQKTILVLVLADVCEIAVGVDSMMDTIINTVTHFVLSCFDVLVGETTAHQLQSDRHGNFENVFPSAGKRSKHMQKSTTATFRCEASRYDFNSHCKNVDAQLRRNRTKSTRHDWQSMRHSLRKLHIGSGSVQWADMTLPDNRASRVNSAQRVDKCTD